MSRRFLVDANLPSGLTTALTSPVTTASHVTDHGDAAMLDGAVWRLATQLGAVIVTKDRDFADRVIAGHEGPAVVWLRFGNTRRWQLVERLTRDLPALCAALDAGERLIEVR